MTTMVKARSARWGLSMLGVALVVSGCSVGDLTIVQSELRDGGAGGGNGDSGASVGPIPSDRFFGELARAICQNIGPCCTADAKPFEIGKCEASVAKLAAGTSGGDSAAYDPDVGGRCIDAFRRDAKSCFTSNDHMVVCPGQKSAPAHASVGDLCNMTCYPNSGPGGYYCAGGGSPLTSGPDGGSSARASEAGCWQADGLYCDHGQSEPRCARVSSIGGSCPDGIDEACKDGRCIGGTCVALLAAGGECSSTPACGTGLYCDSSLLGPHGLGTCAEKGADGAPCATGESCVSTSCDSKRHVCFQGSLLSVFSPIACVQ